MSARLFDRQERREIEAVPADSHDLNEVLKKKTRHASQPQARRNAEWAYPKDHDASTADESKNIKL